MTLYRILLTAGLAISAASCKTTTTNIDPTNDSASAQMALDYRDFAQASETMIKSMIASGTLNNMNGKRPVLAISNIKNDTMQRIDTDQLTQKISSQLSRLGKVAVTTVVGTKTDELNRDVRKLRNDDEFKQTTIAKKGTFTAPDLSLSGKILQKNIKMDDGRIQVEYYFQLTLTQLETGLAYWQDEKFIGKRGDGDNVSW